MEEVMRKSTLFSLIVSAILALSLVAWAASGPNRITTRAACKRWTSGNAQKSCIACVKQGRDYFRNSGQCR